MFPPSRVASSSISRNNADAGLRSSTPLLQAPLLCIVLDRPREGLASSRRSANRFAIPWFLVSVVMARASDARAGSLIARVAAALLGEREGELVLDCSISDEDLFL